MPVPEIHESKGLFLLAGSALKDFNRLKGEVHRFYKLRPVYRSWVLHIRREKRLYKSFLWLQREMYKIWWRNNNWGWRSYMTSVAAPPLCCRLEAWGYSSCYKRNTWISDRTVGGLGELWDQCRFWLENKKRQCLWFCCIDADTCLRIVLCFQKHIWDLRKFVTRSTFFYNLHVSLRAPSHLWCKCSVSL